MIVKARFSTSVDNMKKILSTYEGGINANLFLVQVHSVFNDNCEVVAKSHEMMFLIGHIAGIGEDYLVNYNPV